MLEELAELLPQGWELDDSYGLDFTLVCPCGHTIEPDEGCPSRHTSPLRALGLI